MKFFSCSMLIASLFLLGGCRRQSKALDLTLEQDSPLSVLSVSCDVHGDGGNDKALILRIHHTSDQKLEDVSLSFDGTYNAALEKLFVHRGFMKGTQALGRSDILSGERIEFIFSHDTSNHQLMKNEAGETPPANFIPKTITIHSGDASANWRAK